MDGYPPMTFEQKRALVTILDNGTLSIRRILFGFVHGDKPVIRVSFSNREDIKIDEDGKCLTTKVETISASEV